MCSSQELAQNVPQDTLPSFTITLTLDNSRIYKIILSNGPVFMGIQKLESLNQTNNSLQ